ncbi:hypothetical protein RB653_004080 [Dictyostelium firmibasis]|uniref:Pleckstrin domain-containing protein n=1 Tax=Dictyostelium firmibasis TaxID=79012 RepID=A0AAN7U9Y9_9MYCE
MQPKDYMSSSHANWENIQIDSFTSWINQHLSERGLSVKDLSVDFQDGVLLINLLEILSGKKITRYVRSPKFLQHKIDNIMIAFGFMEKAFDIKVFGCNAKDIVDGNLKQTMGVIFLLIQKIKVNLHLDHLQEQQQVGETTNPNTQTNGATTTPSKPRFYRASMQVNAANRFSHISPNKDQSNTTITVPSTTTSTTIQSNTSTVASQPVSTIPTTVAAVTPTPTPTTTTTNVPTATNNSTTTSNVPTTTTTTTTAPIRILPTTGVSVSTIRSKFLFEGGTGNTSGGNEKYNTFSPSSTTASSSSSNTSSERVLKRTESGHLISGGLSLSSSNGGIHEPLQRTVSLIEIKLNDHQTKFYDLKKIIFMQSVIRGYLIRSKWRDVLAKYKQHLGEYKKHFKQNEKAYRGLIRVQAIVKGRIQRKKLFKMFPLYRRNEIVKEILSTEDKYVTSLAMVTTHYLKPSEAFLSTQQVRSIFSQIEIIHRYNSLILEKLVSRNKIWYSSGQKIGDIFIEMSAFLKVYTIYVNNYNNSIQTITECMEIPKFASLLEKNRNQFGLDLSAFLIAPIQRIPRYILLLQDLLKNTKESHPDHQDLSLALKKMKDVAEYVNEKKREAENLNQVLTIQSSLTGKFNNLAEPHRRYVKKGTLISNDKIHLYFLFNDLLVKTENKIVSKIRDSARLSNGGDKGHKSTYHSKEIINEGKSKYLNSFFLAGSSLVDSNPDGFTFQIIGVGDANELNNQLNNNNDDSPTLSFSPFSSSFASTFTNSLGANNNNNNNNVNNTSGNSGNVNNSNNNNNNNSLINVNSNGSSPLTTSGHGLNSSFGINSGNGISMPTTSIQLEALSLNEKMTWMGELDECIFQLLEKSRSKKRSLITDVDELTTVPFDISVVKDAEFSNILEKKHSEISWRSKKFYLKNTHLYYHRYSSTESPKEPTKIKCINLILCSVKLAQVVDHPHCFQLITPSRIYFFSCEDSTVLFQWISSIRLSIKKKLESLKDDNNINNFTSIDHHNHHNGTSSPIVIPIATHSNATGSLSASLGSSFLSQQQGLNTSNSNLAPLALSSQVLYHINNFISSSSSSSSINQKQQKLRKLSFHQSRSNTLININNDEDRLKSFPNSTLSVSCLLNNNNNNNSNNGFNNFDEKTFTNTTTTNITTAMPIKRGGLTCSQELNSSYDDNGDSSNNFGESSIVVTFFLSIILLYNINLIWKIKKDSILNIPGNNYCAECGASDPSWVSINYGVVVCLDCSSIHKNLPEGNVKSVRSLSLAFSDIVKKQEGNTKANSKYEKNIPTGLMKPNPKDSYETKLSWIKAKYINNNFQQQNGDSTPTTTTTTTIHVNNDSTPTSPTLNSQPPATTTTTTTDNVKLENGRLTPTTNENNITTPNTPAATNGDNISNSSRPTTPTLNNPNEEEHIEGINLKSGTDTSNGKGTWSRGSSHTVTERKTSFLDKPRIPVKREHQGYLFKTSSPTSNNSSDWKKYLFVYKNDVLTYYKVSKKNKRKEKGIIDLFHSVKQESRPKQKYSFTLVTSQRLYFLASETEEEMKTWLDVLSSHTSH